MQLDDKQLVTSTIQAISRSASCVPEVTERCLYGLMSLLGNKNGKKKNKFEKYSLGTPETIVAESVVGIKKLLQIEHKREKEGKTDDNENESGENNVSFLTDIVSQLAKLLKTISIPMARASIIWVIGEYSENVPLLAPDTLRILTKSFTDEVLYYFTSKILKKKKKRFPK